MPSFDGTRPPALAGAASDALVFFGATGDLAYKQIFPALQRMVLHGDLNVPVIGVAKAGWTLEQLKQRAHASLSEHGGVNDAAFAKLIDLLQYIDGDYQDSATFSQLRQVLGSASRPTHYLAIPSARWWRRSVARAARKARAWWWRNRLDGISSPLKS
jgi:glucose-6-phosphate 1-dehydrogenase